MHRHRQMVPQWYRIRNTRIQVTVWVCKRLMQIKVVGRTQVPPWVGEGSKIIRRHDRQAIQVFMKHWDWKLQYCSSISTHRQTGMKNLQQSYRQPCTREAQPWVHAWLVKTAFKLTVLFTSLFDICFSWYIPFIFRLQKYSFYIKFVVDCVVYFLPVLTLKFSISLVCVDCIKPAIL